MGIYHNPEQIKALREAQKRLAWIDNAKRILYYTQEQAEAAWQRMENAKIEESIKREL